MERHFSQRKKMDCLFFLVSAYQLMITMLQLLIIIPLWLIRKQPLVRLITYIAYVLSSLERKCLFTTYY